MLTHQYSIVFCVAKSEKRLPKDLDVGDLSPPAATRQYLMLCWSTILPNKTLYLCKVHNTKHFKHPDIYILDYSRHFLTDALLHDTFRSKYSIVIIVVVYFPLCIIYIP